MELTRGTTLRVLLTAKEPGGSYLRGAFVVMQFWGEGQEPGLGRPAWEEQALWSERDRGYLAYVDTDAWPAVTYRVTAKVYRDSPYGPVRGVPEPQEFTLVSSDS